ncbi:MAG: alpha/beta hydrolase family protein [Actinomycetes bacterium]
MNAYPGHDPREVLTRPAPPPELVVRYGPEDEQVADVWLPQAGWRLPAPLVLVLHGGFWRVAYDRTHTRPMCQDLAGRGYAVASVEYHRVGQDGGGWPGTFDDVAIAVDAVPDLVAAAAPEAVDTTRIVLLGHSAGAHLALWAAGRHRLATTSPWHRTEPLPVAGVVALAGVCDLAQASALGLGDAAVDDLLGGPAARVPGRVAAASPSSLLPLGTRLVLVHGTEDDRVPLQVSRDFHTRATRAGDDVELVTVEGVEHFALIDPHSSAWPRVLDAVGTVLVRGP